MDMNEIKEIFFQECEEQLAELESGLLKLNDGDRDPETVNAVFRAVHSIKGGAGAFGLDVRDDARLRSIQQAGTQSGRPESHAEIGGRACRSHQRRP
jgi:hypothetical protein